MANITYNINQDTPESITTVETFSEQDNTLVSSFQVNQLFDSTRNIAELHIYNLAGELQQSIPNYSNYRELGNAQSAGKTGASILTIDLVEDLQLYEYDAGGVKLFYNFINNLFSEDKTSPQFFIDSISPDRTEVKLNTFERTPEELSKYVSVIKDRLQNQSYFNEFRLNLGLNILLIGINIDILVENGKTFVVVKLYESLPEDIVERDTLTIVELVSDSAVFGVQGNIEVDLPTTTGLRAPNFNLELTDENIVPTGYYNYNTLFSLPISNTTNELYSLVNSKGVQLSIDHTDYSNFIQFSSAQERLLNFKYKLDLIKAYTDEIDSINLVVGSTGSIAYYQDLVKGIVNNFDHYENFLYYQSGSYSWPKTNTTKPYNNDTTSATGSWFDAQLNVAANYDVSNTNILINSIPSYLRDDSTNANYVTFIHMIGQHFDNMWIYAKGVSDKYNADNRLDYGISRDLVAEVLKNFGVKLYTSNKSVEDLFSSLIGQSYQSGSEVINTYVTGSITDSNTPIQPSSFDNYQREVYKRIYHNLPLLLKSKGTERGLRALINCFGIPSDILDIKVYGGRNVNERPFYGDYRYFTSSLGKVRLDNTGSIVTGSTLSQYTSIAKRDNKHTDDLHPIEIGFSPTDNIDNYIISKSLSTASLASFNIDDYLGDPRNLYLDNYYILDSLANISGSLEKVTNQVMSGSDAYNVQDFVRLIKFFDNTIFKMVKDFIPARSVADTGIIIKPHILDRNKAKSVEVEVEQPVYTASIDTAFISGSDGNSFGGRSQYYASYLQEVQTPLGLGIVEKHRHAEAKYDGEFEGTEITVSTQDLNTANVFKYDNPVAENLYVTLIQDFPTSICVISPSYLPITLTSHSSRNISLDFTSLGTAGVLFTTGSTDITSQATAYTFPTTNYQQYTISASNGSIDGCSGSITYTTAYCDILPSGSAPYSIISGSGTSYDLTSWFTTGSNTNTSFTASWGTNIVGIANPTTYTFTQPTGSVTIIRKDNIITTCSQSIGINIVEAALTCQHISQVTLTRYAPAPHEHNFAGFSYEECNGGQGGTFNTYVIPNDSTPWTVDVDICIVSGSIESIFAPAEMLFTFSGNCNV